ncbi:MAG: 2-oxo acid dehydrogenase subunit E2, partial [Verrucomicrobiota bacterium]
MSIELRVPALGESVREATLGAWKHAEGDTVSADEPLVEVESEKATVEVPSPGSGVLKKILRKAGETVAVGEVIAEIDQAAQGKAAPAVAKPAAADVRAQGGDREGNGRTNGGARPEAESSLRAGPSARRALAESGLHAEDVPGSGRGGRIQKQDIDRVVEDRKVAHPAAPMVPMVEPAPLVPEDLTLAETRERVVPMSPLRKTVARRLVEAQQTAAILTTFNEVDMSGVMALRERHQERFQKQHGVKLGFMSFFVKAAIEALRAFPAVNAEVRGTDVVYKDHYDIGVAVGGDK